MSLDHNGLETYLPLDLRVCLQFAGIPWKQWRETVALYLTTAYRDRGVLWVTEEFIQERVGKDVPLKYCRNALRSLRRGAPLYFFATCLPCDARQLGYCHRDSYMAAFGVDPRDVPIDPTYRHLPYRPAP